MISKTPFCFRCARVAYPRILDETRKIQDRERRKTAPARKAYQDAWEKSQSEIAAYNLARESAAQAGFYNDPNRLKTAIGISILFGIILPVVGLLAFFPALWILDPIWDREQSRRRAEFDRSHSPPQPFSGKAPDEIFIPDPYVDLHPNCSSATFIGIGYKRLEILNRDLHTCQICGNRFKESDLEVHHILPRVKGGSDSERNLITLCKRCHFNEDWFDHVHKFNQRRIDEKNWEKFRA